MLVFIAIFIDSIGSVSQNGMRSQELNTFQLVTWQA